MAGVERISPGEARKKVRAGKALLVCAYPDEEKFSRYHLEGAISLTDFKRRLAALPSNQEIIFYCN